MVSFKILKRKLKYVSVIIPAGKFYRLWFFVSLYTERREVIDPNSVWSPKVIQTSSIRNNIVIWKYSKPGPFFVAICFRVLPMVHISVVVYYTPPPAKRSFKGVYYFQHVRDLRHQLRFLLYNFNNLFSNFQQITPHLNHQTKQVWYGLKG